MTSLLVFPNPFLSERNFAVQHYLNPTAQNAHVVIFYCNFRAIGPHCHIGLGVNGLQTVKMLRKHGIKADIFGVRNHAEVTMHLNALIAAGSPPTHAVIEAPWIPADVLHQMLFDFSHVHFIVRTHSQIAFLQADRNAISTIRQMIALEEGMPNFSVSSNAVKLCDYLNRVYTAKCLYLPNLYNYHRPHMKRRDTERHRTLRIGCFGALRPLKNHTTAGAAALMIAERHRSELEFYISTERDDKSSMSKDSLRNMFSGLKWAKLIENPWQDWTDFRRTVAHMDLCIQVSFSESFNIVTADGCCEGVPSVVSDTIEWAPDHWKAHSDDAGDAARIGLNLLHDVDAAEDGFRHLKKFVDHGVSLWIDYLNSNPT